MVIQVRLTHLLIGCVVLATAGVLISRAPAARTDTARPIAIEPKATVLRPTQLKSGDMLVRVTSKSVLLQAGKNTRIKLDKDGDISIECPGDLSLKAGKRIRLDAGTDLDLDSQARCDINAGTELKLNSTATCDIKSAMCNIEAGGVATVKGNPIKLN